MDLNALREMAIEAASRTLYEKHGFVPSEESDEWEDEYRRQFAALKQRYGNQVAMPTRPAAASAPLGQLPELRGTLEEQRWGASIREERLREIPSEAVRVFLTQTWPRAKQWIDTRDVPTPMVLQHLKPQYEDYRKKQADTVAARKAEAQKKAAEVAAYQRKLKEAGITPEGLVELVDASDRFDPAPLATKLADLTVEDRHLRIFETSDPNLLLVKEKDLRGNHEYAIERDEGLVADLKLFAQAPS